MQNDFWRLMRLQPNAKIVSNNSGLRKFLLNWFGPDQDAWQRFSVATDVIAFLRLDHLTTDQNGVSQGALK
jgi:hypothetical protein